MIVPVGGPALKSVLLSSARWVPDDAVWWLDDLVRFADQVDGYDLTRLLNAKTQNIVVATVRSTDWRRLLHGSGNGGEFAKQLLVHGAVVPIARVVLPPSDDADDADLDLGPPDAPDDVDGHEDHLNPLFLTAVAVTLLALAAFVWVAAHGFSIVGTPPVPAQIDGIREQETHGGQDAVVRVLSEPFHATTSYLFVSRADNEKSSDTISIYDNDNGVLDRRLSYQPNVTAPGEPSRLYVFSYQEATDVLGNGEKELFGSYSPVAGPAPGATYELPVVVAFDDANNQYRLSPLLGPAGPSTSATVAPWFDVPYALYHGAPHFSERAVSSYTVLPGATPVLATVTDAAHGRFVISLYQLTFRNGQPSLLLMCGRPAPAGAHVSSSVAPAVIEHLARQLSGVADAHSPACSR